MSDTIQALARALNVDIQGINAVSHNVANINTPGFQGARAVPDFAATTGLSRQVALGDGPLKPTARTLDLALRGDGFFVLDRAGQPLLTRAGSFVRDAEGYLVARSGDRVMTDAGALLLPEGEVRVDEQGVVWSEDRRLAQLSIMAVADASQLQAVDGGYRYAGNLLAWNGRVQQGAIEQSNVDAAAQTLQLIELTRHAESVQRVVSIYDRTLDVGINRIGDN
ncbi:MAG TPA: flagellar hook-basal body protein [Xanthomonadaceae bacterium]|nr:flagellar hook-basal body protein [Xanthomonadaceae bacterium]